MENIKTTQFLVYISRLYFKTRIVYSIILFDAQTSKKSETAIFFFPILNSAAENFVCWSDVFT